MSPLTSNQVVSLSEVLGHEYPGGFPFKAGYPMAEHPLVGVLNARRDVLARELIVRNEHGVAYVHLAKRDVNGVAFARVARRERGGLIDGEHGALPRCGDSEQIVKGELKGMHTPRMRYLLLRMCNHLMGLGGSGWGPRGLRDSLTATTATTYYFKRMAREGVLAGYTVEMGAAVDPQLYDAKRSVAEVAVGVVRASSPSGPRVSAATPPSGSNRIIPTSSAHQMQIRSNAQDLRKWGNSAEVGK